MNRKEMYAVLDTLVKKITEAAAGRSELTAFDCYHSIARSFVLPVSKETAGDMVSKLIRAQKLTAILYNEIDPAYKELYFDKVCRFCSQFCSFMAAHSIERRHGKLLEILKVMESTLQEMALLCCQEWTKGQSCSILLLGCLHQLYDMMVQLAVS